jgi:hypothetical protein
MIISILNLLNQVLKKDSIVSRINAESPIDWPIRRTPSDASSTYKVPENGLIMRDICGVAEGVSDHILVNYIQIS